jgi:L-aminopeptidase/D-esterase-like protein
MITKVKGIKVGQVTDVEGITGCTVILCPPGTIGGCEVRGGAPGTRETALLASEKTVSEVNAVLFTGGSAFGLAAADGVVRYLEERGIGYETPWAKVPLVPAAVVFDLYVGSSEVRPDAEMGYKACLQASVEVEEGSVGAGTGATVGKWAGPFNAMKGGVGTASFELGELVVGALAVVNAVGDVVDGKGDVIAGARDEGGFLCEKMPFRLPPQAIPGGNTTLLCIATNAKLNKVEANILARRGQNALAVSIQPSHTSMDGDTVISLATGEIEMPIDVVAELAVKAGAQAIRNAVLKATSLGGVKAASES